MKTINERTYLSDEGKVFMRKETQEILGLGICLGGNDSIDNYKEVDCPKEFEGDIKYDNSQKKNIQKKFNEINRPHEAYTKQR